MNKGKTNGRDYSTLSSHKRELCFTLCVYFTYYVVYGCCFCCFCSCCFRLYFRQSKGRFLRYLSTIKVLYYVDERSNLTKDFRMISSIMTLSLTTPRSQLEKRRLSVYHQSNIVQNITVRITHILTNSTDKLIRRFGFYKRGKVLTRMVKACLINNEYSHCPNDYKMIMVTSVPFCEFHEIRN